ncbi:MAG: efflux RND transporter periplasmic adaptor subunit [Cytophagales bacterium]|nr:efflux RND transporter periplasmic adaptor subunit [Cytophagales bacterium]
MKSIRVPALIIFLAFGCKKEAQKAPGPVKYVKVHRIVEGNEKSKMVFNGRIMEKSNVDLSFRVGGPLVKLPVKQGDYVAAGSLIAAIDKRDYKVQLESSEAQYKQLRGEFERYKELFEAKKIPANTYEKVEAGYLLAKSGFENAQHQYNDTKLTSPTSGYIFKKYVENYQTVGPGQPIVSIIDNSVLEVVVHAAENQLAEINAGKEFLLNISSANLAGVPVSVMNIAEKAGDNGLYEVKFRLPNDQKIAVYPGMTAEISMHYRQTGHGITIPANAVFNRNNLTYVWIYSQTGQKVNKRQVRISSIETGGKIRITEGLKFGETIVAAGVHYLRENQKVQPVIEPSETNVGGLL